MQEIVAFLYSQTWHYFLCNKFVKNKQSFLDEKTRKMLLEQREFKLVLYFDLFKKILGCNRKIK